MSKFLEAVNHYCDGLTVAIGCAGPECQYMDGDDNHQCEPLFSWSQCDSCGSTLGGNRYDAFGVLDDGSEPIPMSVCTDCALFHANGDEPDEWQQHP